MAGLYIHIPFCRDACSYCDFHFSISLGQLEPMLQAIEMEIRQEKNYLKEEELKTIYLGGGTPSVLSARQFTRLFSAIKKNYTISGEAEITMEANPDDLTPDYLSFLREAGVNRLSIGIQSFHDDDLRLMKRRHDSKQSRECLENAYNAGFDNLNMDLIYGAPEMSNENWTKNLDITIQYKPAHLAAYHLTYEPGTVMDYRLKKNRIQPADENRSFDHYTILTEKMDLGGYQHYEISNFARPGRISKHNSGYWKGEKYLGVGPSAHSYNGRNRRWNISKNASYIKGTLKGLPVYEEESLQEKDRYHDYILTSLRTVWGLDLKYLEKEWGKEYCEHIMLRSAPYIKSGKISSIDDKLILSREGMFIADHIMKDLFI
jgi:putative oxygen-independent coproporphyrinogen III oxidase